MRRRRGAVLAGAAGAVALIVAAPHFAGDSPSPIPEAKKSNVPSGDPNGMVVAPFAEGEPCAGAKAVPVEQILDGSVSVTPPDEERAGTPLTGGVLCMGNPNLPGLLLGDAGVWILYEPGHTIGDGGERWFSDLASQWGGEVRPINGIPAYVKASEEKGAVSQILMIAPDSGVLLRVQSSYGISLDTLTRVAEAVPLSPR